jgi:hypothetical protein
MSNRRHFLCALVLFAHLAGATSPAAEDPEKIIASAFIPSADNVHGETRLIQRTDGACVQTILHSASFRRGIREIIAREEGVWTENKTGYEDSIRYRNELERVKQIILDEPRSDADLGQPYTLVLEFMYHPISCSIRFFQADAERDAGSFTIRNKSLVSNLDVSDRYMSRAMLIMMTAALGPERHDSASLLTLAGWEDISPPVDVSAPLPAR